MSDSVITDPKRRVAIYIRVSTQEQKMDGYSMEAQEKKLVEYVERNEALNLETKKQWIYKDTHTGSDLNRPALNSLREDVKAGKFDAVLVWKIDRFSRSLKHLLILFEQMQDNDVSFISVQENLDFRGPIGSLIFQIFGAIAQFERELIKGRTHMGRIASAEMGNYTGTNIPFGYKKVKNPNGKGSRLALVESEKKWVCQIYNWYIYEEMGDLLIANKLNELKVAKMNHKRTARASLKWTSGMVRTILMQPLYRGEFVAAKTDEAGNELPEDQWTTVAIPPCVSEIVYQQAQEARKDHTGNKQKTDYLLSGKLVDVTLDKPKKFVGARRSKGGFSYRRKQFEKKDGTWVPVFEITGDQAEEFVWGKIQEALKEPEIFIERYLSSEYQSPGRMKQLERDLNSLREQKANIELSIARIEQAYETGTYGQEKTDQKLSKCGLEDMEIDKKIQEIEDEILLASSVDVEVEKLRDASRQVKYQLDNLDRRRKKILCQLFIDRVEMSRRKVHGRWKVTGDVVFRFNPQKFGEELEVVRTRKTLTKATKGKLHSKKGQIGGRCKT